MKLKSFGCSFVFGTDLPNDGRYTSIATPSDHAWPALIAHDLEVEHECLARPGAGNFEICQRIISEASRSPGDIYLINWSWIDRFSYIDEHIKGRHPTNPLGWQSIMPVDTDQRGNFYYKHLHTQLRDKIESLTVIKAAIDICRQCNIEFVMTWTDRLIWETEWHTPPSVLWLQDQIRPYLTDFDGHSFLEWSQLQGFEISQTSHPLIEAHRAAADYWLPKVKTLIDATPHRA
jgi:hypothetical protein